MEHIYNKSRHIILIGTLIISIFLLSTHNGKGPMLGDLDIVMFRAINQHMQSPVLNSLAAMASNMGSRDTRVLKYILLLTASIFFVSIIKNSEDLKITVVVLIIALLISWLITDHLKSIFGIERPYAYLKYVHAYINGVWAKNWLIGDASAYDSFPSGHATMTFSVLGTLWVYRGLRFPLSIILFIIMFLIVYVGQHYVSDIIAGALIGFMVGHLARKIMKSAWKKRYVFG